MILRLLGRSVLLSQDSWSLKALSPCCVRLHQNSVLQEERRRLLRPSTVATAAQLSTATRIVDGSPALIRPYLQLMRLDKPIGSWLLFFPCSWSIALASSPALPSLQLLGLFGVGSVLMRAAGCVINDLWDRDFDRRVERTRSRPLASGALGTRGAFGLLGGLLSASLLVLLQLNWVSVFLGLCSMGLVATYPLAKRYTNAPQLVLGLTINWGAILGWTAVGAEVNLGAIAGLYGAGISWSLLYDTIYAHQDKEDDAAIGVGSTALLLGETWTKPVCAVFATSLLGSLTAAGVATDMGELYYATLLITAAQIVRNLIRVDLKAPESCWESFRSNRNVGALVFVAILLGGLSKTGNAEPIPLPVLSDEEA